MIEEAKYLIKNKGFQNNTIKNLADKISFSQPAFCCHFKDNKYTLKTLLIFHRDA